MNTEQNPITPQGQEPEATAAAGAGAPQRPETPASTPAAEARAAQVPTTDAPTTQLPAAQAPDGRTSPAHPPEAGHTQQFPVREQPATVEPVAGRSAVPAGAGPQETHAAGAGTSSGTAFGNPYAVPAGAPANRKDRRWVPVVSAAAVAALLASAGTAGAVALLDDDTQTVSLADVGRSDQQAVPVSSNGDAPDWQAVTAAVSDSVVSIQVATQQGEGEGSGVVIDADGHVLTNNHVVSGARQVQVTLADGRLFEAEVVGTDPTTDLAVVQLTDAPEDLEAATLGDSEAVSVGDAVMAVGNPLGLANTATTGIVSALDRPVSASSESGGDVVVTNAVQTDAAVNPGNSGGPLFNASGEVIGINSSILTLSSATQQSGSIGLGFAIPSNLASSVSEQLIENGSAEHAFLGVSLSDGTATADGVTRLGARVEQVVAGSPAEEAGLEVGDVIVAIGEDPVDGSESLTAFVREYAAGDEVTLTVVRDGETQEVTTGLAVRDDEGLAEQDQNVPGQGGLPGQEGSDGSGSSGSDPTDPGNIPDWLRELFGN